jgi:hypothetical protein
MHGTVNAAVTARKRASTARAQAQEPRAPNARRAIVIAEHAVAEALIMTGRLTAAEALRHAFVERELARVPLSTDGVSTALPIWCSA